MTLTLMAQGNGCRLYLGDSAEYADDDIDLVLTNPYGPIPTQLRGKPMLLSQQTDAKASWEASVGIPLTEIARWQSDNQAVWVGNMDARPIDLSALRAEEFAPARGWWPLELPLGLLEAYGYDWRGDNCFHKASTVWDGFCGRATTGKACQLLELNFVGIDIDPERVEIARKYLGLERC